MSAALVSVIGPPAVGKTTLAEWLVAELPAGLIREDYAGNPFLADSYMAGERARLPAQVYFLVSRVSQLSLANWPAGGTFVSDYGFCQDRIFAKVRLSDEDFRLYDRLARRLEGLVRRPDVTIHLDAAAGSLMERVRRRGRAFEASMTEEFLSAMRQAYNNTAAACDCDVIRVDCDAVDLMQADGRDALLAELRSRLSVTGRQAGRVKSHGRC